MCTATLCPHNQLYQGSTLEQGLSRKPVELLYLLLAFHSVTDTKRQQEKIIRISTVTVSASVVVQFYSWFNFYFHNELTLLSAGAATAEAAFSSSNQQHVNHDHHGIFFF